MDEKLTLDLFNKNDCNIPIKEWKTTDESGKVTKWWICKNWHIHFSVDVSITNDTKGETKSS